MQIFEYYFNPKAQKDRFFEVFSLEPRLRPTSAKASAGKQGYGGQAEKDSSKGSVYLVGELANALPQNSGLLQKFAKVIFREYELFPRVQSQDAFFRTLLKRANDFFAQELHKGNVDWLGNLHVALLYVKNSGKRSSVMFSKTGGVRIFMTRGTNVVDLAKNIQHSSHGAVLFGSVVSLQAFAKDKLIVFTKDVCDALVKGNVLSDLSGVLDAKQFQLFFKKQEKILSRLSGILFAVLIEEFVPSTPPLSFLKKRMFSLKLPKLSLAKFSLVRLSFPRLNDSIKQRIIVLAAFCVLVAGGFLTFQGEKKELQREVQTVVLQIQVIQKEAESALELNDTRSANMLLQEAWKKASSRTGKEFPFRETFTALKDELEQQLLLINNIQYVKDTAVLVDVKKENTDLIPQNMVLAQGNLYLFNPFSSKLFVFDLETEKGKTISAPKTIRYGISLAGSAVFLGEPDTLLRIDLDSRIEAVTLKRFPPFGGMAGFEKNVYVLNAQQGTIAKYEDPLNAASIPSAWIREESLKKPIDAKSIAIDGDVWILTRDNTLQRYFGGLWQEDIHPLVFPFLKNATAVKTFPGLPYLYILDPSESRIILLGKSGDLVKQYQIEVQDPLLDFSVSRNGNTLYLLAGSRVFAIGQE